MSHSSLNNHFHFFSTVNILLDNFVTLLFTASVIMFDKSNLTIILKYLIMLVKKYSFWNIKEITKHITTGDCMKLWPQQASATAKFFIYFSNINKGIFVGLHFSNRAWVVELNMRKSSKLNNVKSVSLASTIPVVQVWKWVFCNFKRVTSQEQ